MQIVQKLAGYSLERADLVRKAMGKKEHSVMDAEENVFIYGNKEAYTAQRREIRFGLGSIKGIKSIAETIGNRKVLLCGSNEKSSELSQKVNLTLRTLNYLSGDFRSALLEA